MTELGSISHAYGYVLLVRRGLRRMRGLASRHRKLLAISFQPAARRRHVPSHFQSATSVGRMILILAPTGFREQRSREGLTSLPSRCLFVRYQSASSSDGRIKAPSGNMPLRTGDRLGCSVTDQVIDCDGANQGASAADRQGFPLVAGSAGCRHRVGLEVSAGAEQHRPASRGMLCLTVGDPRRGT
jgi:hypothetical protein